MNENVKEIFERANISNYKIVKNICNSQIFSSVYDQIVEKNEKKTSYLIRFLWEGSLKELFTETNSLERIEDVIDKLKGVRGVNYFNECLSEFELRNQSKDETEEVEFKRLIERVIKEVKCKYSNYNLVIEKEKNVHDLIIPGNILGQKKLRYKISVLDRDNNDFLTYEFSDFTNQFDLGEKSMSNKDYSVIEDKKICGRCLIETKALGKILNTIVKLFHADIVIMHKSFFDISQLNLKMFSEKISLLSVPYMNILYDSEGNITRQKYLIKNGYVKNVLSNSFYTAYSKNIIPGEASVEDHSKIETQRVILKAPCIKLKDKNILKIIDFESITLSDRGCIAGIAYAYNNGNYMKYHLRINIVEFLNNIEFIGNNFKWYDNVYITNAMSFL